MKYNQVRIGDGVIVKERNIVIHSLGTLNWDIYDCISSNHIADEVIITEEQMMHIRERHPEAYIDTMHYVRDILDDPDYIFRDKRPNTGLVVKKILNGEERSLLVLKIITSDDNKDYKNSVITSPGPVPAVLLLRAGRRLCPPGRAHAGGGLADAGAL